MNENNLYKLDRQGIKDYIFNLQVKVKEHMLKDDNIDNFLDKTN
mgnify:CR=1 FL=1